MSTQYQLTQKIISARLQRWAARQPARAFYDARGRHSASTDGLVIGSQTPVDCSYCIEATEISYTPPTPAE